MRQLKREEIMDLLCAMESIDELEEMDFYDEDYDEAAEEKFVDEWLEKEMY
jgi:hypothetical protein